MTEGGGVSLHHIKAIVKWREHTGRLWSRTRRTEQWEEECVEVPVNVCWVCR